MCVCGGGGGSGARRRPDEPRPVGCRLVPQRCTHLHTPRPSPPPAHTHPRTRTPISLPPPPLPQTTRAQPSPVGAHLVEQKSAAPPAAPMKTLGGMERKNMRLARALPLPWGRGADRRAGGCEGGRATRRGSRAWGCATRFTLRALCSVDGSLRHAHACTHTPSPLTHTHAGLVVPAPHTPSPSHKNLETRPLKHLEAANPNPKASPPQCPSSCCPAP